MYAIPLTAGLRQRNYMRLEGGTKLGPYEILAALGAGVGEVYRAADSRLGRDVALKVLPEAFPRC